MLKRLPALLLAATLSASSFLWTQASGNVPQNTVNFWTRMPNDELAVKITDEMTDTELLSQTFMFGWAGAEPPELLFQWVEREWWHMLFLVGKRLQRRLQVRFNQYWR